MVSLPLPESLISCSMQIKAHCRPVDHCISEISCSYTDRRGHSWLEALMKMIQAFLSVPIMGVTKHTVNLNHFRQLSPFFSCEQSSSLSTRVCSAAALDRGWLQLRFWAISFLYVLWYPITHQVTVLSSASVLLSLDHTQMIISDDASRRVTREDVLLLDADVSAKIKQQ